MNNVLIMAVNWLGDSVMSLPAIEAYRTRNPECRITLAVKKKLAQFWSMVPLIDDLIIVESGLGGTMIAAGEIRRRGFDQAFVFPNSFRSALIPFLAGVPVRTGMKGHSRGVMLTDIKVPCSASKGRLHQSWEYADIMDLDPDGFPRVPRLVVSERAVAKVCSILPQGAGPVLALIPGAAFGDAKRWPAENFCEVGRMAAAAFGVRIVVLGAPSESDICEVIAGQIGSSALSIAGKTDLVEMAAVLQRCEFAVSNDCGGMHIAAAMGVKTVAVFGVTDPEITGPLGAGHRIVCAEGKRSRDISINAGDARLRLASVPVERVYGELEALLTEKQRGS